MEDVNMQSALHRLWAKRQGTNLSPMHEIRDEILDQGQCASPFEHQVSRYLIILLLFIIDRIRFRLHRKYYSSF